MDTPDSQPKPAQPSPKKAAEPIPGAVPVVDVLPDHTFQRMKQMLLDSTGKLPMPLIIIVLLALVMSVGTGVAIKMMPRSDKAAFLPLRLTPDEAAPVIPPVVIEGYWTASYGDKVMSLRLEKTGFELIVKPPGNNYNRRFSRGSFAVHGDVLVLTPRGDLGKPSLSAEGLVFNPIGLANMNVRIRIGDDGKKMLMLWEIPSSERGYQDRDVLSLFPGVDEKPLAWLKISGAQ